METETSANIDVDVFLLPTGRQQSRLSKKGTISTLAGADDQMQVDEISGIEGEHRTNAPKAKRKKQANVELRKIAVPSHRYNSQSFISSKKKMERLK